MKIILASASPRRVELLKAFNLPFDVIPSAIEEVIMPHETPTQIVMSLALEKAISISQMYPEALVIASDTIVFRDEVLGKPKDREDAKRMLMQLSGQTHAVYTGIALVHSAKNQSIIDYDCTLVTFNTLDEIEIDDYLNTGEAFDKAGAYGIQGYGALLVKKIDGDYFNVMGLPLSKLNSLLKKHFQLSLLK